MTTTTQRGVPHVTAWPSDKIDGWMDLSADTIGFTAGKALSSPTGQWSIQLLPRQSDSHQGVASLERLARVYQAVGVNSVVSLGMEEPGGIMVGLVDSVTKNRAQLGSQAADGLTISGSCMGKVLSVDQIIKASLITEQQGPFFSAVEEALGADNPVIRDLQGVWGPTTRDGVPTFQGVGVADVITWALENAPSMRVPLFAAMTGGTGRPADFIDTLLSITTWNDARVFAESLSSAEGSVWSFLNRVLDPDFYEVCLQSIPQGARLPSLSLMVRPKPFDEKALEFASVSESPGITWEALRTVVDALENHVIPENEILMKALGVSDAKTISYYQCIASNDLIGNDESVKLGLAYPLVDTFMASRYGMRRYDPRLNLVAGDIGRMADGSMDYDGDVALEVREFRNRAFNWSRLNPFFEEGTIQVAGRDRYRPGDPVFLPDERPKMGNQRGVRYYCPSVQWSWKYGGHYTTTLRLERGHNGGVVDAVKALIAADAPASNPTHFAET